MKRDEWSSMMKWSHVDIERGVEVDLEVLGEVGGRQTIRFTAITFDQGEENRFPLSVISLEDFGESEMVTRHFVGMFSGRVVITRTAYFSCGGREGVVGCLEAMFDEEERERVCPNYVGESGVVVEMSKEEMVESVIQLLSYSPGLSFLQQEILSRNFQNQGAAAGSGVPVFDSSDTDSEGGSEEIIVEICEEEDADEEVQ